MSNPNTELLDINAADMGVKFIASVHDEMEALVNKYFEGITRAKGESKVELIKEVTPKLIKLGMTQANIARVFQFSPAYLSQIKSSDQQFEAKVETARKVPIELVENICFLNALKSARDPRYQTSMIFYLKNVAPQKWRDVKDIRQTDGIMELIERMPAGKVVRLAQLMAVDISDLNPESLSLPTAEPEHDRSYRPPEDTEGEQ